jgi:hypothetical protein
MKKTVLLLSMLLMLIFISGCGSNTTNDNQLPKSLAKCLSERGAIMYGTDWCHFCQEQKERFGESFQFVTYVNCDYFKGRCEEAGIKGYPSWVIYGKTYSGVQSLERLAEISGCQIQDEQ